MWHVHTRRKKHGYGTKTACVQREVTESFPLRNFTLEWKCTMEIIASATSNAAAGATLAEERKLALYGNLFPRNYFVPVAFETSRVIDPQSRLFLKELTIISRR